MSTETPSIDELKAKYAQEREKRMSVAYDSALTLSGELAHYLDDPHTPVIPREPIHDSTGVVIVGAGIGGLLMAVQLHRLGIDDIRIVDAAGDVGGVWYWNRYPGAMCDIEALIYMPLLEELDYVPTMRYASGPEIFHHLQNIARTYGLYDKSLFHTTVLGMQWDDTAQQWVTFTDRGDELRSRFGVIANGPLSRPKLPAIPGLETFTGTSFHTSRWDYGFTGGGPEDYRDVATSGALMTNLRDKRVGVIGNGATGLQCVPKLAEAAEHLFVFQRTPQTVAPRNNRPIDPEWARSQEPGWTYRRRANFSALTSGARVEEDLVGDCWTDLYHALMTDPDYFEMSEEDAQKARELADFARMDELRQRIDAVVEDPETADKLKPWYAYQCKRPGFHDEYLPAFNRDNVTLVDTDGKGIDRLTPTGAIVAGREYTLDCLVFATGFEVETAYTQRNGFDVHGRDGISLSEKWDPAISTLHGMMSSGFPNLIMIPGIGQQAMVTVNQTHGITENTSHGAYIISETLRRGARSFEVDEIAEREWCAFMIERSEDLSYQEMCTPSWRNNEGRLDLRPRENTNWGGDSVEYFGILEDWRSTGDLVGLQFN